jgi:hypothetical protein
VVATNRTLVIQSVLATLVGSALWIFALPLHTAHADGLRIERDVVSGEAAWESVYSVLTSPRCINCHTASSYPQQGDDRRRHFANVTRGAVGKGVAGLNCASCHQEKNADPTGVPGAHGWHLAPLSMRWQDSADQPLSSAEVCRALTNRAKNHGLDGPGLLGHHQREPLVLWAWNPGRRPDGAIRSVPPLTHEQFISATREWIAAGTPCPK